MTMLAFDARKFEADMATALAACRPPVQQGMAEQFRDIVMSNFGPTGVDRPYVWPPLSDRSEIGRAYIRQVGRSYATLFESGLMASAVRTTDELFESTVSLSDQDCPYASKHHWGAPGLPMRRVFPILTGGQVTPYTIKACLDAAQQIVSEVLR